MNNGKKKNGKPSNSVTVKVTNLINRYVPCETMMNKKNKKSMKPNKNITYLERDR